MTNDPGMKEMLAFLIARDTMHQQQWLAVIEELGERTSSCRSRTASRRSRRTASTATSTSASPRTAPSRRAAGGPRASRIDGNGEFSLRPMEPQGDEPNLGTARPNSGAQAQQIKG